MMKRIWPLLVCLGSLPLAGGGCEIGVQPAGAVAYPPPQQAYPPPQQAYPPPAGNAATQPPPTATSAPPATYRDAQGTSVRFAIGNAAFADRVVSFEEGRPATQHPRARNPNAVLGPPEGSRDEQGITLGCGGRLTVEFTDNVLLDGPGADLHVFETGPQVESMEVEISVDGRTWADVGAVRGQPASLDIHNVAQPGAEYRFVRITDLKSGCGSDYPGADIDAVGTITGRVPR